MTSMVHNTCTPENLDDISNLKDPEFFYDVIDKEVKARNAGLGTADIEKLLRDASYVAEAVSDRYHSCAFLVI